MRVAVVLACLVGLAAAARTLEPEKTTLRPTRKVPASKFATLISEPADYVPLM